MTTFHPIVYWGQNKEYVLLSVKVYNTKNLIINISEEEIHFKSEGEGSNGYKNYVFDFQYYLPILPKLSSWKVKENFVEIKLKKEFKEAWQRFTRLPEKYPWLKSDFNKFYDESDYGSDESEKKFNEKRQEALNDLMKKPTSSNFPESEKFYKDVMKPLNLYLLLYNLVQFAGFIYVFGACIYVVVKNGWEGRHLVYPLVKDQLATVQILAFLEIIHAQMGWVKSSTIMVLMQVLGRNMVLFMIVMPHEPLHKDVTVYYLILAWSSIEIIRYPYYLLMLLNESNDFLTWLRYTIWIPLYPMGFMSEGKLILKSMPLLEESKRFSISMPNSYNLQFNFVIFLYIYIPLAAFGFYFLMMRLYSQRKKKIGPTIKKDWSNYNFLQYLVETFGPKSRRKVTAIKTKKQLANKINTPKLTPYVAAKGDGKKQI